MALLTMIARTIDGLPLAASMPSDEQTSRDVQEYQSQAKMIFKKLTDRSPSQCSIESGNYMFHYTISNGVCYLALAESSYPKRLMFTYLEDLATEFASQYLAQVPTVVRPYYFIEFDTYIQKAKRKYADSKNRRNLNRLNDELQDVHKVMIQNIDDVLQRGENLTVLDDKAGALRFKSDKYKSQAKWLNMRSVYAKYAAVALVIIVFVIYVRYWWL